MKKAMTLLMALTMVFGFAAIAAADCFNCAGTAGNIARGCETGQDDCYPFDFEGRVDAPNSYCDTYKVDQNRAVFKICDCITDGDFETVVAGDTIDISMEILVNGESGDNGVYWAEYVGTVDGYEHSCGVEMETYEDQEDACDDTDYDDCFEGNYEYLLADGSVGCVYSGDDCILDDEERVVKFELENRNEPHGYVVTTADEIDGNASWAIDIPWMRVDPSRVVAGDKVWVRICLLLDCSGICSDDVVCCCDVYIGELCCSFDSAEYAGLIYPYFPPANSAAFNLLGMTITNLAALEGSATITMYEDDGDVGTLDVTIPGNGIYLTTIADLTAAMTSTGTLGDAKSYLTVTADFPATGFAMIADTIDGASMGYLPLQGWEVYAGSFLEDMK
ncbi:MAG: hypothetical protein HF978_05130 [Desulfobacteraceae bacterium]|nr:hypothetical protein [Desulfobacteraceae bacterium]MBC2754914.1 hypothetical protein [Desulfobacteraceae bacterium]